MSLHQRRRREPETNTRTETPRHRLLVDLAIGDMMLFDNPALRAGARLTISVDNQKENKKALHAT